jgi:hypothetical protein
VTDVAQDWADLRSELDAWRDEGWIVTLWWRDDDAIEMTPALSHALSLSTRYAAPIHLSVIPAHMSVELPSALADLGQVPVLQHGYAHARGELYWERPHAQVLQELCDGYKILRTAMQEQFLPILVPPWNLIRDAYVPLVQQAGLEAVSVAGPRAARLLAPGVEALNIHAGPLRWHDDGHATFAGTETVLDALIGHLKSRRSGSADLDEPTGFCTHHLNNDDSSWAFFERLLEETSRHTAAQWIDLRQRIKPS